MCGTQKVILTDHHNSLVKEISSKHLKSCICRWTDPTRTLWRLQRSNLPKLIASERETVRSWMSWPSTSCNKAPWERRSRWGEEVSKQQPVVACTFSYWLSLYPQPLCGCQLPYSNLAAERAPLPCPIITIFPSCLSYYRHYNLIILKRSEHLLVLGMPENEIVTSFIQRGVTKAFE